MRIALIHDMGFNGGAEQSAGYLLRCAPESLDVHPTMDWAAVSQAKGAIVSGMEFASRKTGKELLELLLHHAIPYVVWDHHVGLGNLNVSDWHRVFRYSRLNLFMSPLHRSTREQDFAGSLERTRSVVLPVGIDHEMFTAVGSERSEVRAVCMMTRMDTKKHSVWQWAQEHPELMLWVYADTMAPLLENVSVMGFMPREVLPGIYNRASIHVDLPGRVTAGGNATYEAVLCGCKAVVSAYVGAASWSWAWNDTETLREKMQQGNRQFWQEIGNALGA